MDNNIQDSVQPVEAKAVGLNGLGDFSMKDLAIFNQINEQMSKNLGDSLPAMTLYTNDGVSSYSETKAASKSEEIKSEDLKNANIKATKTVEDGKHGTNAEYPNGVGLKIESTVETKDGKFQKQTDFELGHNGDLRQKGNSWVDANGKEIVKKNDDGTFTVDSGKGIFKQGPNGIVKIDATHDANGKIVEKKR